MQSLPFHSIRKNSFFWGESSKRAIATPAALKKLFPTLDNFKYLDKHYVIDIANNNLRLVALIFFESQKFYVRHVFTHKEYDRFTEKHRTKGKK